MSVGDRPTLGGIILAGGRSSRFGRDKLIQTIDGQPLLWWPIRAVAAVADEILLVLAPTADPPPLPADLAVPVVLVRDAEPFGGPLSGAFAGLSGALADIVLIVAGDQPGLRPELLSLLASRLEPARPGGSRAAALIDLSGDLRPLPCIVIREPALRAAAHLLDQDDRRLRSLLAELHGSGIPESEWSGVDPLAQWTRDIDVPEDLESR